jgi:cell division transport system permease protein
MRFFFGYALRETRTNLWRNRMMTLAAVLTVAVSLFLVGGALFLKQSASQAAETWQNQTRVQIWMTPSASASEIAAVQDRLTTLPYVSTCTYFDKAAALAEAKRITAPDIAANLTLALVPTKYVCTPKIPSDTTLIESTFTGEPGVLQVTAPDQTIKTMEQDVRVMQIVCLSIALLLVIAAMVQILNTIRIGDLRTPT